MRLKRVIFANCLYHAEHLLVGLAMINSSPHLEPFIVQCRICCGPAILHATPQDKMKQKEKNCQCTQQLCGKHQQEDRGTLI